METKPILALDLDGCIANYIGGLIKYLTTRGIHKEYADWKDRNSGVPEKLFYAFDRQGLKGLELVPGSERALKILRKHFSLVIVTARPIEQRTDTLLWLYNHFHQAFFSQVIFDKDKGAVCKRLNAIALVEDNPKNLEQYSPSFCIAQPWNEDYKGIRGNWDSILPHILTLANIGLGAKTLSGGK